MKDELEQKIAQIVHDVLGVDVAVELTRPEEKFGDYATNVALQLSKQLGRNPRDIAEELAARVRTVLEEQVSEVTIAGPAFINLRLSDQDLFRGVQEPVRPGIYAAKTTVIETNNPNPFKAMHIGHAFNAILGDTIANLLDAGGAQNHRVSYHGDIGLHVGRSMWALLKYIDGDISKLHKIAPGDRNTFMSKMYAEGTKAYKEDTAAKAEIERLVELSFTLDEPLFKAVYDTCITWSFESLEEILQRLGTKPVEKRYLESQADAMGVETVKAHVGTVFKESDGAVIFEGDKHGSFTNVFVSSRGRGLYAARDLGLMRLKHQDFHPDKSYIVTAEEQRAYFVGVIKAAELTLPELKDVTVNISTGTVKLATGKMSSREGDVLEVSWLFDQVEEAVRARGAEPTYDTVLGSLRYQFLKVRIGGDVIFDASEAVSITGNSGPYLQYAHARACSILAKSQTAPDAPHTLSDAGLNSGERTLVRKMSEYPEVVSQAVTEMMPHHICTYLYELAQEFNRFYENNRVIGDPRESDRLVLVSAYRGILSNGLKLLGITAPEKM